MNNKPKNKTITIAKANKNTIQMKNTKPIKIQLE